MVLSTLPCVGTMAKGGCWLGVDALGCHYRWTNMCAWRRATAPLMLRRTYNTVSRAGKIWVLHTPKRGTLFACDEALFHACTYTYCIYSLMNTQDSCDTAVDVSSLSRVH